MESPYFILSHLKIMFPRGQQTIEHEGWGSDRNFLAALWQIEPTPWVSFEVWEDFGVLLLVPFTVHLTKTLVILRWVIQGSSAWLSWTVPWSVTFLSRMSVSSPSPCWLCLKHSSWPGPSRTELVFVLCKVQGYFAMVEFDSELIHFFVSAKLTSWHPKISVCPHCSWPLHDYLQVFLTPR